jgi:hypothetical protein
MNESEFVVYHIKDIYRMEKKKKYESCKEIQMTVNAILESSMHLRKDNSLVKEENYDIDGVNSEKLGSEKISCGLNYNRSNLTKKKTCYRLADEMAMNCCLQMLSDTISPGLYRYTETLQKIHIHAIVTNKFRNELEL